MLDLLAIALLGFLGSFGHCAGMCGPLTVAFSLTRAGSADDATPTTAKSSAPTAASAWRFHLLLNLGRLASYAVVGAAIGGLGSVLVAGGQMAGVGSDLRQLLTIATGLLLIWWAIAQLAPDVLPRVPLLHPLAARLQERLHLGMGTLARSTHWWTPLGLGAVWGLIPCGFLYAAQITAAQTGSVWLGAATMFAFGAGTLPMMVGVGTVAARLSRDRRSQLFRLGSWIALGIGILMLVRSGNEMTDYSGHASLLLLGLALAARPLSRLWAAPLHFRRALGVGAYILALVHAAHTSEHALNWNPQAIAFLLPLHRWGVLFGIVALLLLTPAALTSCDRAQKWLGPNWRRLHLLSVPALGLVAAHALLVGSHYLGSSRDTLGTRARVVLLVGGTAAVFLARSVWFTSLFIRGDADGTDQTPS
ncbi:hypothetical protein KR51_00023880 [Rubidibacter lacunae KORDI 51-2]|uniref:Ferric reductase n=1 Tax=Rubidibacter lacunae KORDI 51-2 TaxID=582515 RepID=U5DN67_9CHRO|nr:sulfite exporter TauE/SafE family protein [Rubidibacter lacunae]ERN41125.1 hypothetical protein KR51_00023880 [Rubidibacter lacunae KORDI 51-2]